MKKSDFPLALLCDGGTVGEPQR